MYKNLIHIVPLLLLVSCSSEDEPNGSVPSDGAISFNVDVVSNSDSAATRGTTVNHPSGMSEFTLYAPLWEKGDSGYSFEGYEIENERVSRGSDGEWTTSIPYYWPQGERYLNFIAFYPAQIERWSIASEPHSSPGRLRFFYTPPYDSEKQHDILLAFNNEMLNYTGEPDKRVKLTFTHILTNIKFKITGDATLVKEIKLCNVYGSGGFHPGGYVYPYGWDYNNFDNNGNAPRVDYTVMIPEDGNIGDNQTLIIIPQQMPDDASIEVIMRDGKIYTRKFAYHTFLPGMIRTININLTSLIENGISQ